MLLLLGLVTCDQFMFTLKNGAPETVVYEFARLHNYTLVEPMFSYPSPYYMLIGHPSLDHKVAASRALSLGHELLPATIRNYKRYFEAQSYTYADGEKLPINYYFPSPLNVGTMHYGRHNVPPHINGSGVRVVFPDGGMDCSHMAFVDCDANAGKSYVRDSPSTGPESSMDTHATMCASLVCADNGYGGGLANGAKCIPHRFMTENGVVTNFDEMRAFAMEVPSCVSVAMGPEDGVWGYELANAAVIDAIDQSADRGSIRFDACGNGGSYMGESCSTDWSVSSRNTPGVASIGASGRIASYSEKCPGVLVCGFGGYLTGSNVLNTAYPDSSHVAWSASFDGTSAVVPQITAIAALAKQANPRLRQRDMHRALIETCSREGLISALYPFVKNAAGYHHSLGFGFGFPKADKLIEYVTSPSWKPQPPEGKCEAKVFSTKIEKKGNHRVVVTMEHCALTHIENVQISLNFLLDNSMKMDSLTLTSPAGTTATFIQQFHKYAFADWQYKSGGWTWYGETAINGNWTFEMSTIADFSIPAASVLVYGY